MDCQLSEGLMLRHVAYHNALVRLHSRTPDARWKVERFEECTSKNSMLSTPLGPTEMMHAGKRYRRARTTTVSAATLRAEYATLDSAERSLNEQYDVLVLSDPTGREP